MFCRWHQRDVALYSGICNKWQWLQSDAHFLLLFVKDWCFAIIHCHVFYSPHIAILPITIARRRPTVGPTRRGRMMRQRLPDTFGNGEGFTLTSSMVCKEAVLLAALVQLPNACVESVFLHLKIIIETVWTGGQTLNNIINKFLSTYELSIYSSRGTYCTWSKSSISYVYGFL